MCKNIDIRGFFRTTKRFFTSLSEKNRLLLLSLVVGVLSGLAAVLLEKLISLIGDAVKSLAALSGFNWTLLILPSVGMLLSFLFVAFVLKDNIGHGVTKVLLAISRNDSKIKAHNMWSSVAASSVTIGFGGSVGAEAPIVYTGAAIGSNLARWAGMSYRNMTILLGCGAAGAIAGIFKAPLAAVLFTMEILLFNISMSSMVPLLLSSVSAAVVSHIFLGPNLPFQCTLTPFSISNIPFYVLLGVICGFGSLFFTNITLKMEDRISSVRGGFRRWIVCAVGLGILIFLFPSLYGEGYDFLGILLNGGDLNRAQDRSVMCFLLEKPWSVPLFFLLVFALKVVAMTLTNSGGGVGGTFGPTLFAGAILGFAMSRTVNLAFAATSVSVPEQNFALVGMAALMAGVMQAPMTAIFLIAEISGGYDLLIPLIIASTISFGTVRLFDNYSIYTRRIAHTGDLLTHDNDMAVLTLLKTKDLVRDKYPRVSPDSKLREILPVISQSSAAVFPVVDSEDRFQGLIDMDNARRYIFDESLYDTAKVYDLMEQPLAFVYEDEKMDSVMQKFDETQAWRLPVVTSDNKYLGFISKSRILSSYREELKEISQD